MKKAGAKRKMILNTKTCEIINGLRELCDKNNLNMPMLSNKLNGKTKNNTDYLYVNEIEIELNNPYKTENEREFNILQVFNYIDNFGGGDVAIVQMLDNNKKYTLTDRVLAKYIEISIC